MTSRPWLPPPPPVHPRHVELSAREAQMLEGLLDGLTYRQIAKRHFIKENTVRTHMRRLYRKLRVSSGCAAVTAALTERVRILVDDKGRAR